MHRPSETQLAAYAIRSDASRGRRHPEADHAWMSPFERDRHRIMESTAFRRLEQKTQVFAPTYHDHFRTRLTHTLEAAHLARCLAALLRANELLTEAITLAHDLGHPPFGHAGEAALDQAMAGHGGFNHNAHSLRVVEELEHPIPAFRGLNLTVETRNGLASHRTPYDAPGEPGASSTFQTGREANGPRGGRTVPAAAAGGSRYASVEAQIASIADRIAYDCHDLEDAIGAGFVGLKELAEIPLWQNALKTVMGDAATDHIHAVRRVVLDRMLDTILADVMETSRPRLAAVGSPAAVQPADAPVVLPSEGMQSQLRELERFLSSQVYRRPEIISADTQGQRMVAELFAAYRSNTDALPPRITSRMRDQGRRRVICDYIAGMTDRFCRSEYDRLVVGATS